MIEPLSGQPTGGRYRELDALRGVASLGIAFWHYRAHFHAMPLMELFEPFYLAGYYAVDFFFVLSGVVLAKAYLREPRRFQFSDNLMRRLARIYPIHIMTLLVVSLLQFTLVGLMDEPPFVTENNDFYHFLLNLTLSNPLTLILYLVVCLVLSGLSYRYVERPAQARINRGWSRLGSARAEGSG